MIGRKRLISITRPVAMSHGRPFGGGAGVVVESVAVAEAVERRAVVRRRGRKLVNDLREAVRAGIARRLHAPIRGGKQAGRPQDHDRVHEQRDHRQLHLARADLLAQIFGRAPDHLPGDEDADDEEQQQVDHADALAAVDAVEPHADHRREPGESD